MKHLFLILTATLAIAEARFMPPDRPGPFAVETLHVQVPSGSRRVASLLYRPLPGTHQLTDQPAVVFGHGLLASIDRYDSICRRLSSHGFYVLVPGYPNPGLFSPRSRIAGEMLAALDFLDSLGRVPGMELDPHNVALVGHSMGGGAAFLAARLDTLGRVTAVAGLSPWSVARTTMPESLRVPTLVFAGSNDRTVRAHNVRRQFYEPCTGLRQYVLIHGGGHNGYLDHTSRLEDRFEPFDRATQLRAVRTYLTAFLRFHLDGDHRNGPWLFGPVLERDPTVTAEYDLPGLGAMNFVLWTWPEPTRGRVYLRSPNRAIDSVQVYRPSGKRLLSLTRASAPRLFWDATDDTGAPVPDGRYLLRAFTTQYGFGIPGLSDLVKRTITVRRE